MKELARRVFHRLQEEPVLIAYTIALAANVGSYFGMEVDPDLLVKVDAVLIPMLAIITRRKVTPVAKLRRMTAEELIEALDLDEETFLKRGEHEA